MIPADATTPCRAHPDPDRVWFTPGAAALDEARAACRPCHYRDECRATAVQARVTYGIWAGEDFTGRTYTPEGTAR